ncbi:hypothetical protein [Aeromonas sp. R7-1]|uniref:endonuclease/exonuclease/phosphatase family protein n=1 Tax=Aeromonas sp. R7-1 TaxID=3138473 RepID=UPI0034A34118
MLIYKLRFGWWNAALSPSAPQAGSNASDETYPLVCKHIKSLLTEKSCDFLALSEVSSKDINHFINAIDIENITILDMAEKVGKTRFDIAVIYNNKKLKVKHISNLSKSITGNIVKAAQIVEVINIDDSKIFYIYLCHWASRLNGGEEKRNASASMVYQSAMDYIQNDKDVIILGDFNDNPYDRSLNVNLQASRCHDAVRKYPNEFFYNPFWRTIVSEKKYSHLEPMQAYPSGSHKYKTFQGTIWHSYDQAIVSGSLISGGRWCLNEYETNIISSTDILNDYSSSKCFIDHLPIVCEITRTEGVAHVS